MASIITNFFTARLSISRRAYFAAGMAVLTVKAAADILLTTAYGKEWDPSFYFLPGLLRMDLTQMLSSPDDTSLAFALLFASLPPVIAALFLCLGRLRDTGLSNWYALLFFIPGLNFFGFLVLTLLPTGMFHEKADGTLHASAPMVTTLITVNLLSLFLVVMTVLLIGSYGVSLFMGVPFINGFIVARYAKRGRPDLRLASALRMAALSVALLMAAIFFLAIEGAYCITMALPPAVLMAMLGAFIAWASDSGNARRQAALLVLLYPFMVFFEQPAGKPERDFAVTSTVTIAAPPARVWQSLVSFPDITTPPSSLVFAGIAYPVSAEIIIKNGQRVRYCRFNTGSFEEPITIFEENRHMKFTVTAQPDPMRELSPVRDLDVPHLDGYFKTTAGEFRLQALPSGQTRLSGTTWYRLDIGPAFYWKLWSDYFISLIHSRVLNHIEQVSTTAL